MEAKSRKAKQKKATPRQRSVKLGRAGKARLDELARAYGQDRGEFLERLLAWISRQSPAVANWALRIGWSAEELSELDGAASGAVEGAASEIAGRRHQREKGAAAAG